MVVMELRYVGMTIQTYLDSRMAKVGSELADVERDFTGCIQPADWTEFSARATKKMDKAYAAFCSSIYWGIVRGAYGGLRSFRMASSSESYFKLHGSFGLLAVVPGDTEAINLLRLPASPNGRYDYVNLALAADRDRKVQAYLAFDMDGASPASICYGTRVESPRKLQALKPNTSRQVVIAPMVDRALLAQEKRLQSLLPEFERIANAQARRDRLIHLRQLLKGKIRSFASMHTAFKSVHLPTEQLIEVVEQLERLLGATHMAAALLLKGSSGTGKTLLAQKVAEAAGIHFAKAGVNTLKKANLGESAVAVRELWEAARRSKPCVLFIDELDAIFGQRGSGNTDKVSEEITNAFLAEFSGKEEGIWVIGATNRREVVDDSILSRFGMELELTLPDEKNRMAILDQELAEAGFKGTLPANASNLMQGMSGRDISMLAQRLAGRGGGSGDFVSVVRQIRAAANPIVDIRATWESLIVSDDTRSQLQTTCAILKDAEGWAARGVSIPTGILLEGPAGSGKTQIARTIANEGSLGFVKATAADLKGLYLGHAAANVRDIFAKARAVSPSILFIDELDLMAPCRNGSSNDALVQEIISQTLQEMDGVVAQNRQVFVLAATNLPENIDASILSRFTERLVIPLPNMESRVRMLKVLFNQAKIERLFECDYPLLGKLSHGMSLRDIRNWLALAQRQAATRAVAMGGSAAYSMTRDDLLNATPDAAMTA
jgi:SpoVK/Ycf46/Vps4 family AAA+-type ATPase